jgi:hypothetical protein
LNTRNTPETINDMTGHIQLWPMGTVQVGTSHAVTRLQQTTIRIGEAGPQRTETSNAALSWSVLA